MVEIDVHHQCRAAVHDHIEYAGPMALGNFCLAKQNLWLDAMVVIRMLTFEVVRLGLAEAHLFEFQDRYVFRENRLQGESGQSGS